MFNSKVVKTFFVLLCVQIAMFLLAQLIIFTSDGIDGIAAIFPLGAFFILAFINFNFTIVYFAFAPKEKLTTNIIIILFVIINILFCFGYSQSVLPVSKFWK
jgi:hypothetical protein